VVHTLQLAGDAPHLSTATTDQPNATAAFVAKAVARSPEDESRQAQRIDAIDRLSKADRGRDATPGARAQSDENER